MTPDHDRHPHRRHPLGAIRGTLIALPSALALRAAALLVACRHP